MAPFLMLLSPAKTMDFSLSSLKQCTSPRFKDSTNKLVNYLRSLSKSKLTALLKVSNTLGQQNYNRYQQFDLDHQIVLDEQHKQAILAFTGAAYQGLDAATLNKESLTFAQDHLRILCAIYGSLRPLDVIQPCRLEMGQKVTIEQSKDLYVFWSSLITNSILQDFKQVNKKEDQQGKYILLNLASQEYAKCILTNLLTDNIQQVNVTFKDNGKVVAIHAKKARGLLCRYIIINKIQDIELIKSFNEEGYEFSESESSEILFVFHRHQKKRRREES